MRAFGWAIGAVLLVAAQTAAAKDRFERALQKLAPDERLEQLCDYTAMARILRSLAACAMDSQIVSATDR